MGILLSSDPMEIIKTGVNVWSSADLVRLGITFQRVSILLCVVSMAASLVGIILSNNPQGYMEGKKDIANKLIIVFVVSNLVLIFNGLKAIFDAAF